jgi:DNA-binding CsgD family transcriptional regulator
VTPPALVGREAEVALLVDAFGDAGGPGLDVVVVVGEPGMGKTRLVRDALARSGAPAVLAEGDPAEIDLDYGLLDLMVRRAPLDAADLDGLVPEAGMDPLAAGARLLRFVDRLALDRPLVVVVDDVQWVDGPSLDALTFAARRVRGDQVVLCLVTRHEGLDRLPAGMARLVAAARRIDLGGLDAAAVDALAADVLGAPVGPAAAERLRAHTEGSPLHAGALLRELPPGALAGDGPLPAPRSYGPLVLARLAACGPDTQALVEALAVLDRRPALAAVAAVAGLDDPLPAVDEAVAADLVSLVERPGERSVEFTHPLVGAAVAADMPASRRAEWHRAAGAAVPGAAGMRHRLAGCLGHDAGLAAEAAALATAEAERGAYGAAARLWAEVTRVDPDPARAEAALLEGVHGHLLAGDLAAVTRLRDQVEAAADGAERSFLLGRLAYVLGPRREADAHLANAWDQVTGTGPPADALAGRIAALRATTAVDRADGPNGLRWARAALERAGAAAADCSAGHMLAMSCALVGRLDEGIAELTAAIGAGPAGPAALADLHLGRGVLRLWAHDLAGGAEDLGVCLAAWGPGGTFVSRETARFFLAELHFRAGRWDDAVVVAETAASIVDETDQVWLAAFSHAVAVLPLAARGETDRAAVHLAAARVASSDADGGAARLWAVGASIQLAAAEGDHARVTALGDALARHRRAMDEAIVPWRATYAETLAAAGRAADAASVADWLAADAAGAASARSPLVAAELSRARIAAAVAAGDLAAAAAEADAALAAPAAGPGPFGRARLELAAGAARRAAGDREGAAAALADAHRRFEALGAAPWAGRAALELAAAGRRGTTGPRRPGPAAGLTAQERAVAHVVAKGRTNREAADELFVSIKTVEHHLSRIYAKLGIRSRTELASAVRAGALVPAGAEEARPAPV